MIERLQIMNFQRHGLLRVRFDPAITVIVGPSDSGKSAIVRALRWLAMNQPSGDAFIRDGSDGAVVRLGVDEHVITRTRGRENTYVLDGREYKSFRDEPPADVSAVLNVGPLNFQGQHDAPFWFSLTAGEVARQLNAIIDLGVIDSVLSNLAGRLRSARAAVDVGEQRLAVAETELAELAFVPMMVAEFRRLEVRYNAALVLRAHADAMSAVLVRVNAHIKDRGVWTACASACRVVVSRADAAFNARGAASSLASVVDNIRRLMASRRPPPDISGLTAAYERATNARAAVDGLSGAITRFRRLRDSWRRVPDISRLSAVYEREASIRRAVEPLSAAITRYKRIADELATTRGRAADAVGALESEMGGICPVCGRELVGSELCPM